LDVPRYATLSYCWGIKNFIKLTRDNLEDFLKEIPKEKLPKTFTDAIYTARALGLQYIWIDSLCIVQGESDHLDWISESGKMRFVYGSAHVNIAATTATDVYEGCLTKALNYSGGFLARVSTRKYCCVRNFHARDVYDASTSETHLATRAWTLQERLLAPRTIYLGKQGLFCECRTTWISEFLPRGSPDILAIKLVVPEDTPWRWSEIVSRYSHAKMTNAADKLPALSGIARRQHEANGGHYLAGMWKENLLRQLVWSCSEKGERPEWRAPSWSWTSVNASIHYWSSWNSEPQWEPGSDEFARVLDVWTNLAGSDPFGAVTDGELRMSCRGLVCGSFAVTEDQEENEDSVTIETSEERFTLFMDTNDDESTKSGETLILLPIIGGKSGLAKREAVETAQLGNADVKESKDEAQDAQRDLLATSEIELSDQEQSDSKFGELEWEEMFIAGLVLSSPGKRLGEFRRIGSFSFRHRKPLRDPDTEKDQYTEFIRVMLEVGASTAASWCAETLPDSNAHGMPYVITIK
jgi:hypothetical protein